MSGERRRRQPTRQSEARESESRAKPVSSYESTILAQIRDGLTGAEDERSDGYMYGHNCFRRRLATATQRRLQRGIWLWGSGSHQRGNMLNENQRQVGRQLSLQGKNRAAETSCCRQI
jgi:hypothetical protein